MQLTHFAVLGNHLHLVVEAEDSGALARGMQGLGVRLARYGVAPRNLATFRRWADNEADLLERIVAPELRSANPEKRHAGLENLETLAALSQELSNLLFWRALRGIVPRS